MMGTNVGADNLKVIKSQHRRYGRVREGLNQEPTKEELRAKLQSRDAVVKVEADEEYRAIQKDPGAGLSGLAELGIDLGDFAYHVNAEVQ